MMNGRERVPLQAVYLLTTDRITSERDLRAQRDRVEP